VIVKKLTIFGLVGGSVILATAIVLTLDKKADAPTQSLTQSPEITQEIQTPSEVGTYNDYSEADFAKSSGTKLLFFHAPWCPQCRQLDADIKSKKIPKNVNIFKVDYDTNQALRKKHAVTIQTTVVKVDADGNTVKKYVAYDMPTLSSIIDNLL